MARKLVIAGAGGFGREVFELVSDLNGVVPRWDVLGFLDDDPGDRPELGTHGASVLGGVAQLADLDADYLIAIGSPAARRRIDELASGWGRQAASVVHPSAAFGRFVEAGDGLVVASNASVTTDIAFGRHVHVNINATVGHDCRIGDFVTINPGANLSGNVVLGDEVTIGTGAAVIQGCTIGAGTFVGAGAVVTSDLPAGIVAVGVPARAVKGVR